MKKYYFSIIVPVYNTEQYIHQCIDSVLHQEFKDFELLLVNDGSKDKSLTICKEYAKTFLHTSNRSRKWWAK